MCTIELIYEQCKFQSESEFEIEIEIEIEIMLMLLYVYDWLATCISTRI